MSVTNIRINPVPDPDHDRLVFIHVGALDGETLVQDLLELKVVKGNKTHMLTWFYTNPSEPDAYVVFASPVKGTFTVSAKATNGVIETDTFTKG